MAIACTPEITPVTWSVFYELGELMDSLATELNTPGYVSIREISDAPFIYDTKVPFSGAVHFQLKEGTTEVTGQYLSTDLLLGAAWVPTQRLANIADRGDLYLLMEPDGCLCRTLFKVVKNGDRCRLEEVGDPMGCCQTLYVPQVGDFLDYDQHIIPAAEVAFRAAYPRAVGADQAFMSIEEAKCTKVQTGVGYFFKKSSANGVGNVLFGASRKMTGYFVWPIRARYMQLLWDKFLYIIACRRHAGSKEEKWIDSVADEDTVDEVVTWIAEGCSPTLLQMLKTLKREGLLADEPGCYIDGLTSWSAPVSSIKLPWEEATCGAEECEDSGGLKIYCQTVTQLEVLINETKARMSPYTEGNSGCCCELTIKWDTSLGEAGYCPITLDGGATWQAGQCIDYECYEGAPGNDTCAWTGCSYTTSSYWYYRSPMDQTFCPAINTGEQCAAYCDLSELPIGSSPVAASAISWDVVWQLARDSACEAHRLYEDTRGDIPEQGEVFLDEDGNAYATTRCGRWRVETLASTFTPATPSFAVAVYIQLLMDDVPIATETKAVVLNHDTDTNKMVSGWFTPDSVDLSAPGENYAYNIEIDESARPVKCR